MPRYFLYARKSSESEDRQVLSIDSQIRELTAYAHAQGFDIASVLSESRSAKAPGRPVFGEMMTAIARGKADAVLCWKLDRLARNPVDGAALIWAVDEGKLKQIATRDRAFANTGNDKFWMQLEFGMAKKYVDDLSDNVKRGNRAKLEQGWLPGVPPLGYVNDLATKTIVKDPARFDLVRQMWDLVLKGWSPPDVLLVANEDWGFRTRQYRKKGGGRLQRSYFYHMLADPFYYGLIHRSGETYPGAHPPMVSKDEFDQVQEMLGRPNRSPKPQRTFAFTGLIRCGECGAAITAEEKVNRRYGYRYCYYHCTRRKHGTTCRQDAIRVDRLETQIRCELRRIAIDDDVRDWAIANLRSVHEQETRSRQATDVSLDAALRDAQKRRDALVDLRLRGLLTDAEFLPKKQALVEEELRLRERLTDSDGRGTHWLELAERAFLFANQALKRFNTGSLEEKREILVALGSNFLLEGGNLRIQLQKPFHLIAEGSRNSSWLGIVDGVRTFFANHPRFIRWPSFCLPIAA